MKEKKFNCYECKYQGGVAGSAHSSCNHPSVSPAKDNSMLHLMSIFASVGRVPPINVDSTELNIKGNPHGIKNGWFNFPFNFDPIWLEQCDGFQIKEN